ncbi:MAG: NYN domain-containing protein [Nanoarchaeota archaeon]|nr:NYN domain-containing protein [Nanoarchaeota archaeon]
MTEHEKQKSKHKLYKSEESNNISMLPGDLQGSPDESLNSTIVFIDEGFLGKLSKHFGKGKYLKFNKIIFAQNLCKKERLNCKNILYYTSPPFQGNIPTKDEELKKEGYDRFIRKLNRSDKITIREGRCQRIKSEEKFVYKQKAVDILLAMDLMSIPINFPGMKRIILISSDSDFVPVVKFLREKGIRIILYTYYESKRNTPFSRSNYLIKSVNKYVLLTKQDFQDSPLK